MLAAAAGSSGSHKRTHSIQISGDVAAAASNSSPASSDAVESTPLFSSVECVHQQLEPGYTFVEVKVQVPHDLPNKAAAVGLDDEGYDMAAAPGRAAPLPSCSACQSRHCQSAIDKHATLKSMHTIRVG